MLLLMLGLLTTSGGALDDSQLPKVQCEMLWHAELNLICIRHAAAVGVASVAHHSWAVVYSRLIGTSCCTR